MPADRDGFQTKALFKDNQLHYYYQDAFGC